MLKLLNGLLLLGLIASSFILINQRFMARGSYAKLSHLQNEADKVNKEYTRLQIEEGTYSSDLVVQDYALARLNLVQPDKAHILEIK